MRIILMSLTLLITLASVSQSGATRSRPVGSVYIGSVDDGLDNERFRGLLKDALEREGFVVAGTSENADSVLSGRVSGWSESSGMFKAVLKDQDGKRVWEGSVPRPIRTHKTHCDSRDTATALAQKLARAVRSAKIRSVRSE